MMQIVVISDCVGGPACDASNLGGAGNKGLKESKKPKVRGRRQSEAQKSIHEAEKGEHAGDRAGSGLRVLGMIGKVRCTTRVVPEVS
jgi:hypothetical protein